MEIARESIASIETEAFKDLKLLAHIDLSHQLFTYLPEKTVTNCENLREVDLSDNSLMMLQDNTFFNLTLNKLNLTNNKLSLLGNNLQVLDNKDLVVDLTNNNISILLEVEFKPYIETRKNNGHCMLQGNPLSCSCEMRWILALNYQWSSLFRGADCADGTKMSDVSAVYLEQMCPPPSCSDYNPILNTFKSEGLCELYPEMTKSYCGVGTDCVSNGGTFNCVCRDGYEEFVPRVGCSIVQGLLITGGEGTEYSTEIFVPSTNTSCNFVRMPNARDEHSQEGFQVCGGEHLPKTCDTWNPETGLWTPSQTLRQNRLNHNSWVSEEGVILLGGSSIPTTTEMLSNGTGSSNDHFSLKFSTRWACAIAYEETDEIFLTGGLDSSNTVTRYGKNGFIENLPTLKYNRYQHGCAGYHKGKQFVLLVAGGFYNNGVLSTTEIFEVDRSSSWTVKAPLPTPLYYLKAATLNNIVYMTGGYYHYRNSYQGHKSYNIIYVWDSEAETWSTRGQMKSARYEHGISVIQMTAQVMKYCGS